MNPARCPICDVVLPGTRQEYPDYPFCSRRCRLIDLGRWLGEDYRVAGKESAEDRSTSAEDGDANATH